jgi:hypothetical protein
MEATKTKKEYHRKYYLANKEKLLESNRKRTAERAAWFIEYKSNLKCKECDQGHPSFMEFHHINPLNKIKGISKMVRQALSVKRILAEIEKCDVLYYVPTVTRNIIGSLSHPKESLLFPSNLNGKGLDQNG